MSNFTFTSIIIDFILSGKNALLWACKGNAETGNKEVLSLLIEHNADLEAIDNK